jgi:hypothetical protein
MGNVKTVIVILLYPLYRPVDLIYIYTALFVPEVSLEARQNRIRSKRKYKEAQYTKISEKRMSIQYI